MFTNEIKSNSNGQDRGKFSVQQPKGTQYNPRYIMKQKHSNHFSMQFFVAIIYGYHTDLIHILKYSSSQQKNKRDKGGLDIN